MIADAEELNTHKPLAVRFFGKDFALYRGRATGKVVLLDAYCPHMKTHLSCIQQHILRGHRRWW